MSPLAIFSQTNTFQGIVISDLQTTYTVYLYQCDLITWGSPYETPGSNFAVVGFNAQSGIYMNFAPFSGTNAISDIDCLFSECDQSFVNVIYKIGTTLVPIQACVSFVLADINLLPLGVPSLPQRDCPCTLLQANSDIKYFPVSTDDVAITCYLGPILGIHNVPGGILFRRELCCYLVIR